MQGFNMEEIFLKFIYLRFFTLPTTATSN